MESLKAWIAIKDKLLNQKYTEEIDLKIKIGEQKDKIEADSAMSRNKIGALKSKIKELEERKIGDDKSTQVGIVVTLNVRNFISLNVRNFISVTFNNNFLITFL